MAASGRSRVGGCDVTCIRSILTCAIPVWANTAATNFSIIQVLENKTIRMIVQACWYFRNVDSRNALKIPSLKEFIIKLSEKFYNNINQIDNITTINIPSYDSSLEINRKRPKTILHK
ncbi:hypothetical protein AVEN_42648-1 [Araneus ventricosus]|uniref:Reverse transcriptase domain-containing protein n=1 Tax=Araneus ventricosus TaxID=182803 RepID=A0A4Y2BPS5_ARAVE|nr:hypothetical protein AVEN_42648-1 [Araneus ventricosus]